MINLSKAQILENYSKQLGSEGNSRKLYLHYAGYFLDYVFPTFDRQTIDRYLNHLRSRRLRTGQRGHKDGGVNFIFHLARTVCKRSNIEWPYRHGESPQIREDHVWAPALDPDTIMEMIETTKEKGSPDEKAFLSLSTTYGLRSGEMVNLTQNDVRLKDRAIHIATLKHGRDRTHLIPEEIVPCLEGYDFSRKITKGWAFVLWYRLEHLISLEHIPGVGFHSIRRTLNTLLARELSPTTVKSFLRHKQRTSSDMTYRYSAVRFVGKKGESTQVTGQALDDDTRVFQVHPFLKYWK